MDINLVIHAKDYIDDLARGINPITKENTNENDVINNVKISRCLFYVSDLLNEIIDNGGITKKSSVQNEFEAGSVNLDRINISDTPVTVSVISRRINEVKPENMKKLKVTAITNWLVSINMLEVVKINGKNVKRVTDNGTDLGICTEEHFGQYGKYYSITYNKDAQQFIVDNLNSIIEGGFNGSSKTKAGKPWSSDEEFLLKTMFEEGTCVKDIAVQLQRSNGAVKARLEKLGLIK
ncbi:MAG: hypothetical protein ACI4IE_05610 [Eubacterium sp.]